MFGVCTENKYTYFLVTENVTAGTPLRLIGPPW